MPFLMMGFLKTKQVSTISTTMLFQIQQKNFRQELSYIHGDLKKCDKLNGVIS